MAKDCFHEMVHRVSWFSNIDYYIWGVYEEVADLKHEIAFSPKTMADATGYDSDYVGRRLRSMRDAGLLEQKDNGLYTLSKTGQRFVRGDVPPEKIEALDPDRDD